MQARREVAGGAKSRQPRSLSARAIGHLARRDYGRVELRAKLLATGAEADEVDAVLDALVAQGYLSDVRFAQAVVRQKTGQYSRRAIAESLKAKGVPGEATTAALDAAPPDDDATMVALWQRRFGKAPADDREKARQVRFLQSRGFGLSAIFKLLRNPPVE